MKKAVKWFSLFLAFTMIFTAMQFVSPALAVEAAGSAELHRLSLTGDAPYAEADIENGSKYIHVPPTATFQAMTFELFQPLRGTGTGTDAFAPANKLNFTLTVNEAPGEDNAFIVFNPKERVVTGGGTRPWCIMIHNDGFLYVRNGGEYKKTDAAYELGKALKLEVVFNFTDYSYTVSVDGTVIAKDFAITGESTKDTDGRNFGTEADNMGIIAAVSAKVGSFDIRNISAGITNLVDDDTTKNTGETNPIVNADDTKTYLVGPTHIYQKPQDVVFFLQPGDTVEITGGVTYPAPLHYHIANGVASGTADKPITFKGIAVNGQRPVIRSAGAVNVIEINADHVVLEGLEIEGHLYRAMAVRGFTDGEAFANAYPGRGDSENKISFRGIFLSGGENNVIRNCKVHGNYQGIQSSGQLGSTIIEYSDIYNNGSDPYGHNIYLDSKEGAVIKLRYNYIHDTILLTNNGFKSRAWRNEVHYNTFENLAQAMELIGPGDRTNTPRDGEVIGNLIVDCSQGMRVGGDGVGPGTRGRYRIINNTYANINNGESFFLRTFTQLESIELHNNIVYSVGTLRFWSSIDSQWVGGVRIYGRNNWFSKPLESEKFPYQMVGQVLGEGDPFVNSAEGDFRPSAQSTAGKEILAMTSSSVGTVETWPLVEGRTTATFDNPTTTLTHIPYSPATGAATARIVATDSPILGAFAIPVVTEFPIEYLYDDVSTAHENYEAIAFVTDESLMGGTGSGRFSPDMRMTRAMLASVIRNLALLAGQEITTSGVTFSDVPATAYYAEAVDFAVTKGYLTAIDGQFMPDRTVSLADLCAFSFFKAEDFDMAPFAKDYENQTDAASRAEVAQFFLALAVTQWAAEAFGE